MWTLPSDSSEASRDSIQISQSEVESQPALGVYVEAWLLSASVIFLGWAATRSGAESCQRYTKRRQCQGRASIIAMDEEQFRNKSNVVGDLTWTRRMLVRWVVGSTIPPSHGP